MQGRLEMPRGYSEGATSSLNVSLPLRDAMWIFRRGVPGDGLVVHGGLRCALSLTRRRERKLKRGRWPGRRTFIERAGPKYVRRWPPLNSLEFLGYGMSDRACSASPGEARCLGLVETRKRATARACAPHKKRLPTVERVRFSTFLSLMMQAHKNTGRRDGRMAPTMAETATALRRP